MLTFFQTLASTQNGPQSNPRTQPAATPQIPQQSGTIGSPQPGPQHGHVFGPTTGPAPPFGPASVVDSPGSSPQLQHIPHSGGTGLPQLPPPQPSTPLYPQSTTATQSKAHTNHSTTDLPPPSRPVFGMSLDDLLRRDGSAIPLVVYQCLQAVDLYGLDVEGVYRLSGSAAHVAQLRAIFDNGRFYDSRMLRPILIMC